MSRALLAALAVLGATGCDRAAKPAPQPTDAPAEAPAPAPSPVSAPAIATILTPEGQFDAISNTAMSITGDLTAAAGALTFSQGQDYGLSGVAIGKASDTYADTKASFSSLISVPDAGEIRVFKVTKEEKGKARNGGLCGADATTYVVTHQGVDSTGGPALFVIAFKGAAPPSATSPEADLCGTYMYAPKAAG